MPVLAVSLPRPLLCSPGEHCPGYRARVLLAAGHTVSLGSGLPSLSAFKLSSTELSRVSGSDSQNGLCGPWEGAAEPLVWVESPGNAQGMEIPLLSQTSVSCLCHWG